MNTNKKGGFQTRPYKTRPYISVLAWLIMHQPVQCQVCFRWMFRKTAIYKPITTGGEVPLCPVCDRAIFRPFSKEQRN